MKKLLILTLCLFLITSFAFAQNKAMKKVIWTDEDVTLGKVDFDKFVIENQLKQNLLFKGSGFNFAKKNFRLNMTNDVNASVPITGYVRGLYAKSDLDQDGKYEILVPSYESATDGARVFVYEVTDDNTMEYVWSTPAINTDYYSPRTVTTGDLDGDGYGEIICMFSRDITDDNIGLYIYEWDGSTDNGYGTEPVLKSNLSEFGVTARVHAEHLEVFDLDGDGDQELFVPNNGVSAEDIFLIFSVSGNMEIGGFATLIEEAKYYRGETYGTPYFEGGGSPLTTTICDTDGDGNMELFCTAYNYLNVFIIEATGADTYTISSSLYMEASDDCVIKNPCAYDIDGDGADEIFFGGYYNPKIYIFDNTGDASTLSSSDFHVIADWTGIATYGSIDWVMGDLDENSKPELYVTGYPGYDVVCYEFTGTDATSASDYTMYIVYDDNETGNGGAQPLFIPSTDLDGDGTTELIVGYASIADSLEQVIGTDTTMIVNPHPKWWVRVLEYSSKVKVTFTANTATIPDTIQETSFVQLRGMDPFTWDNTSPGVMTNIGGDYWKYEIELDPGDSFEYKLFTNPLPAITSSDIGWEANTGSGNRTLTVGNADTVLPLQFANGISHGLDQYFRPYTEDDDTVTIWVRVNMHGIEGWNGETQTVGVRGSNTIDWGTTGNLDWGTSIMLEQESSHGNSGQSTYPGTRFYSGAIRIPKDAYPGGQEIAFKFVNSTLADPSTVNWESVDNRTFRIPMDQSDTTIHWSWWNNEHPVFAVGTDSVEVSITADLQNAISTNGFAYGDTVVCRLGYGGTASDIFEVMLARQGFGSTYTGEITIQGAMIGDVLYYQYYKLEGGSEIRENYYNFLYDGETVALAERRETDLESGTLTISDTEDAVTSAKRMPVFRNTNAISQDVLVTYTVDMRPAVYQILLGGVTLDDIQGDMDISTVDAIFSNGVYMNGPATGGWATWSASAMADYQMYDDGTHGDAVAGDTVYTLQIQYYADSLDAIGQEFKFGIGGGDNEGGYGNNHIENIDDSGSEATIEAYWGSIDPVFYNTWNYNDNTLSGIEELTVLPDKFELEQNYPNPFNPETTIKFAVPKKGHVKIEIFDVLGRKVGTLIDKDMDRGKFNVTWDGRNHLGIKVSSGMYIYRMIADGFINVRKMILLK